MREREREIWIMGRVNNELQIINKSNNNKMNNNTRYSNTTEIFNINTDDNNWSTLLGVWADSYLFSFQQNNLVFKNIIIIFT